MTKLCCFNQDNPISERSSVKQNMAASKRVHLE